MKAYLAQWSQNNKEKRRLHLITYRKSQLFKANRAKYRNTEKYKEIQRRYSQSAKGKELNARHHHRRRARKLGAFTFRYAGDFSFILDKFRHACAYCGATLFKLTEDHVIPLSWGGHDAPWNIVPACNYCNSKKGARVWLI